VSSRALDSSSRLQEIIRRNRRSEAVGVYAVCSAHPEVIAAAAHQARDNESVLHVESTSSQVNQFGGYTGQNPQEFAAFVTAAAHWAGLSRERLLLGGDHLGPFPWRSESSASAMEKAHGLVRACVLAGYQKIHLDASMACADDPKTGPDEETVATRAAALCETAETAFRELPGGSPQLLYVVGTEVPTPGGESESHKISVTTADHVQSTLAAFKGAFAEHNTTDAWERVVGLVVQPGVEFGDSSIFEYDRAKAEALSAALPSHPLLAYEAHSTEYQSASCLKQMVEDHFAILKVGPGLTFAYREALFALENMERELLSVQGNRLSDVSAALDNAMLRNPAYWKNYYHGDEQQLHVSRRYSYSDRCRYYWHEPEVKSEIDRLLRNLTTSTLPPGLISQYLPLEYEAIRAGVLKASPSEMIGHHIRTVLRKYAFACGDLESTG